jgi:hypothetical protein
MMKHKTNTSICISISHFIFHSSSHISLFAFKETSTRYRLAKINERLTRLERQMEIIEGAFGATD